MQKRLELTENQRWREEMRLAAAAGLLGFSAAAYTLLPKVASIEASPLGFVVRSGVVGSGGSALLYLIATASYLKYAESGFVGWIFITPKTRRVFFDTAVNAFTIYIATASMTLGGALVERLLPHLT